MVNLTDTNPTGARKTVTVILTPQKHSTDLQRERSGEDTKNGGEQIAVARNRRVLEYKGEKCLDIGEA